MQLTLRQAGKIAIWAGSTLTLTSVAVVSAKICCDSLLTFYVVGAAGISATIAGLLAQT
jgi:hypothetical protein